MQTLGQLLEQVKKKKKITTKRIPDIIRRKKWSHIKCSTKTKNRYKKTRTKIGIKIKGNDNNIYVRY